MMQNELPIMMQVEKQTVDVEALSFEQTVQTMRSSSRSNFLLIGKLVEHAVEDLGKTVDELAESVDFDRSYLFSARKCYQRFGGVNLGDHISQSHLKCSVGWDDAEEWLAKADREGWSYRQMEDARKSDRSDKSKSLLAETNLDEQEVEYDDVDEEVGDQYEGEAADVADGESADSGPNDGYGLQQGQASASTAEDAESGDEEESDESAFGSDVEYEDVPDDEAEPEPDLAAIDMPKIPPGSTKEQVVKKMATHAIKSHCSQVIKTFDKCGKLLGWEGENHTAGLQAMGAVLDALKAMSEGKA